MLGAMENKLQHHNRTAKEYVQGVYEELKKEIVMRQNFCKQWKKLSNL